MVWDVADHVLVPYEWVVIVRLELFRDKLRAGVERLELLLAEHVCEVALNCEHSCSSHTVANDADRCDCLAQRIR